MLLNKQRRRDQVSIIASILDITKEGAIKTKIMYGANLSFAQLSDYLLYLIENGLIEESMIEGKEGYLITQKGLGFLKRYRELANMLECKNGIRKAA